MIPLDTLATFVAASLALCIAPGPDNLFVLAQSAAHGKRAGLLVTLGLCSGLMVHTTAVALGVAIIFQTSPIAFTTLKFLGAVYLLYLAWQAFKSSSAKLSNGENNRLSAAQLYQRGIIMNLTNPKVSIFFLAFLPQFTDPAQGTLTSQLLLLGALFIVATLLVFGGIALLAASLGNWLRRSARSQRYLNRFAGGVFVILALRLLFI